MILPIINTLLAAAVLFLAFSTNGLVVG